MKPRIFFETAMLPLSERVLLGIQSATNTSAFPLFMVRAATLMKFNNRVRPTLTQRVCYVNTASVALPLTFSRSYHNIHN